MQLQFALLSILCPLIVSLPSDPVCTNGFTLVNNKCLQLYTNQASHKDAETTCRSVGATLATVKNAIENRAISTFVASRASLIWIGLYCFDSALSQCEWDDFSGSTEAYNNFAPGFPLIDVGKCVYYSTQGALAGNWLSGDCESDKRAYVCELPYTYADNCPYNYNGHCYTFHNSLLAFPQAQDACEQECGNLASIHSPNENRYISSTSLRTLGSSVLLGGIWPSYNVFSWVDGSPWDYTNMDPTLQHLDNCMVMSNSVGNTVPPGMWTPQPCNMGFYYVCKRPAGIQCPANPPVVHVTPVPSNPSYCNSSIMAPGVITSPNYPSTYNNNDTCSYQLSTVGSYRVFIKFTDFTTEGGYDVVKAYDGKTNQDPVLGTYSGNLAPFSIVSTGNTMLVTFTTDRSNVFKGFSGRFAPYSG